MMIPRSMTSNLHLGFLQPSAPRMTVNTSKSDTMVVIKKNMVHPPWVGNTFLTQVVRWARSVTNHFVLILYCSEFLILALKIC